MNWNIKANIKWTHSTLITNRNKENIRYNIPAVMHDTASAAMRPTFTNILRDTFHAARRIPDFIPCRGQYVNHDAMAWYIKVNKSSYIRAKNISRDALGGLRHALCYIERCGQGVTYDRIAGKIKLNKAVILVTQKVQMHLPKLTRNVKSWSKLYRILDVYRKISHEFDIVNSMGQQPSQSARGLHLIGRRYLSFGTEAYNIIPIGFVDYFSLAFEEII